MYNRLSVFHCDLISEGKLLKDTAKLEDCNITEDSTLHFVLQLRGGGGGTTEACTQCHVNVANAGASIDANV